jgi:hypothetical protein
MRTKESPATEETVKVERRSWVSVDPPYGVSRWEAELWAGFIYVKTTDGSVEVARFAATTERAGWDGLGDLDAELLKMGWVRSSGWEIGSGRGFVAWLGG